jgi:DNA repair exonuclease SbcCD ATPase subunit
MFSLGDLESKLNEALETNAILQSDMESKDDLTETVQRLRDETRDLKQELAVRQKTSHNASTLNSVLNSITKMDTSPPPTDAVLDRQGLVNAVQQQTTLNTILNELNLKQQQQQQQQQEHQLHKTQLINGISDYKGSGQAVSGMAPSARISALNFVGDALRKVTVSYGISLS